MPILHPFITPSTLIAALSASASWFVAPRLVGWNLWPPWVPLSLSTAFAIGVFFHSRALWGKECWRQRKAANAFGDESYEPDGLSDKQQHSYWLWVFLIPLLGIVGLYLLALIAVFLVKSGAVTAAV